LTNLTSFDIRYCAISDAGVIALANGNLTGLTSLNICGHANNNNNNNNITDAGVTALANGNLTMLTSLNISYSAISDAGIVALANDTSGPSPLLSVILL
jgi:hypothetical protein